MSKTIEQEREEKVKLTNRKCQQMDAARSVASGRASFQLPRARVALAGLLFFAAAGFAAMTMKPPKLPWVAPLIPTGSWPVHIMVDQATNTAYIANQLDNTISVVDGRNCSAGHTLQCNPIATISPGPNPSDLILDAAHRTLFATLVGGNSDSIAVIDITNCNASNTSGCTQTPKQVVFPGSTLWQGGAASVPFGFPSFLDLDETTHTLYVPDANEGPIYILDTSTCNGSTPTCSSPIPTAAHGDGAVVERAHHSVFVVQVLNFSERVEILDSSTCNSTNQSGCGTPPSQSFTVGFFLFIPATVDEATHTLYVSSQDTNFAWVLDGSKCNATRTDGCTKNAPTTPTGNGPSGLDINPNTQTLYVANQSDNTVSVIDASACNQHQLTGCNRTWQTAPVGSFPFRLSVNKTTNSIYVAGFDGTVSIINGATCNAAVNSSCNHPQPITAVGATPNDMAIDETTNTIYVANRASNTVSIIDGTHCQGSDASGCGQPWPVFNTDQEPQSLFFDPRNGTLYLGSDGEDVVSIIDTTHCNNHDTTDCSPKAIVPVRDSPVAIGVLFDTNTVFVVNRFTMKVTIFDGSTCNATNVTGCLTSPPPQVSIAAFPDALSNPFASIITARQIAIDQEKHTVFIPTLGDTDLVVLNGDSCRPDHLNDCKPKIANPRTGGIPNFAAVDPSSQTVYVANLQELTISIAQDKY